MANNGSIIVLSDSDDEPRRSSKKARRSKSISAKDEDIVFETPPVAASKRRSPLRGIDIRDEFVEKAEPTLSAKKKKKRKSSSIASEPLANGLNVFDDLDALIAMSNAGSSNGGNIPEKWCAASTSYVSNTISIGSTVISTTSKRSEAIVVDRIDEHVEAKKKKRNKDEIALEKLEKQTARDALRRQREEKKLHDQMEKDRKRIENEISTSMKSKAEQYLSCHVGDTAASIIPQLETITRVLLVDRNLSGHQIANDSDICARIEFRRKAVELTEDDDGRPVRFEFTEQQQMFAVVIEASALKDLISARCLEDFVIQQKNDYGIKRSQMTLLVYGKPDVKKPKLNAIKLPLWSEHRCQIEVVMDPEQVAVYIVQTLRALANKVRARFDPPDKEKDLVEVEKGIRPDDGFHSMEEMVADWWSKMLAVVPRMSNAQRRAILEKYPKPFATSDRFKQMDPVLAIHELSELVAENGRKLGPAMAYRLYHMFTDEDGTKFID